MIVRERPGAVRLFFARQGSVVQRIWPQVLCVALVSAAIVAAHRLAPGRVPAASPAPFTLIGIALSIFLGFRNSASYDRWWEGRRLWGQLLQAARDIARQTMILDEAPGRPSPERRRIVGLVILFARTLLRRMRPQEGPPPPDPAELPGLARAGNPPDFVLGAIAAEIAGLQRSGRLTDVQALPLHESLVRLSSAQAGCERILTTPLPFAYTLLMHRTAYVFCFALPFGLADALGWATPFATAFVAYNFFGVDALSEELEEPFGLLPNDLPIEALATTVEINLREALGETDLPPWPQPVNCVLI